MKEKGKDGKEEPKPLAKWPSADSKALKMDNVNGNGDSVFFPDPFKKAKDGKEAKGVN